MFQELCLQKGARRYPLSSHSQPLPGAAPDLPSLSTQDGVSSEAAPKEQRLWHETDLSSRLGCTWRGQGVLRQARAPPSLRVLTCKQRWEVVRESTSHRMGEDLQHENLGMGRARCGAEPEQAHSLPAACRCSWAPHLPHPIWSRIMGSFHAKDHVCCQSGCKGITPRLQTCSLTAS